MEPKHPIIHTTRESFFDLESWFISKKGNAYIRDHGHTYTIVKGLVPCDPESCPPGELPYNTVYRAVIVGPGGARLDIGPFNHEDSLLDALWPEGESTPRGV